MSAGLTLAVAGILAAVVLFLVLRPDDEEASPPATPTDTAENGTATARDEPTTSVETEPETTTSAESPNALQVRIAARGDGTGDIRRVSVERGQRVTLIVTSDVADHVHLHGYDVMRDVAPGAPARIVFRATAPGRFEVELEDRGIELAELRVDP